MATGTLLAMPWFTALDTDGVTLPGALVYVYLAGTTTPVDSYSDVTLTTPNANPVVCDAAGRATIYLVPGVSYKVVLKNAAGSTIRTADNLSAVPAASSDIDVAATAGEALTTGQSVYLSDGSGALTAGRWYKTDADVLYASVTPQIGMVPGDIASGAAGAIRIIGRVTGLSGLTVGSTYYLSATAGAITATAPLIYTRVVGQADSTTSLILTPNPRPFLPADSAQIVFGSQVFS